MPSKLFIVILFVLGLCLSTKAQDKKGTEVVKEELPPEVVIDSVVAVGKTINPLSPSKAAFYSAVLPGLGQAYNKKYWKIPIVYAALGTGIYFYTTNNKEYNRYRDIYKRRLAGFTDDEFYFDADGTKLDEPRVTTDGLVRGQKFYRKNKELSLLITLGLYALNIIDANVDAHLLQYNVDENLSLAPHYKFNEIDAKSDVGLTLSFKF
ncbi:MAG: DUF5683 domain-containing protein [Aestuariibaculum sp.]